MVRFVVNDDFYEGTYQNVTMYVPNERLLSLVPLYLINTHYLWWVRRFAAGGSRLLELGCGSGVRFIAAHTRATGLELSFSSLRNLADGYELAVQGDALNMPVIDGAYDTVAASYFYEHIPLAVRPQLLSEIRRVLRPGGRLVLLFDVSSQNPLFRWFRQDPEKFRACFIEHDHHYGLETASANLERFRESGFRVLDYHLANKTPLQHLPVYEWCRPYGHPFTRMLSSFSEIVHRSPHATRLYGMGVTIFDDLVERLFPMDWSRIMLVALERM